MHLAIPVAHKSGSVRAGEGWPSLATQKLLRQDLFEEFCEEFTREMNRLRMEHRASLSPAERELERVQGDTRRVIEAIKNGFAGPDLKAEWDAWPERKMALKTKLDSADEPPPLLHPGMAELYRQKGPTSRRRRSIPTRAPKPLRRSAAWSTR
jgi:hypothetical protein